MLILKSEDLEVIVTFMAVFVVQRDSAYIYLRVSNPITALTTCKQKHAQKRLAITLN